MTPEERIDRYLLGQANSEDIEILNELLQRDEALRQAYRFRVALEGGCREAALRDSSVTSNPDPATQLPDWRFSWLHPAAAAAVGVGTLRSDTKSIKVVSVSCPTAEIIGILLAKTDLTTFSSLNAHKSSMLPPPRAMIITSGDLILLLTLI